MLRGLSSKDDVIRSLTKKKVLLSVETDNCFLNSKQKSETEYMNGKLLISYT